jgi:hypothetical protein
MRNNDGPSFLLSGAERNFVRVWRARIFDQAQHHHDFHVDRADAQRREVFVFFVMVVAAAEATVGLAIIIAVYRTRETLNVDRVNLLKL